MLDQCWSTVYDARPTSPQHWDSVCRYSSLTQETRDIHPMFVYCWAIVCDAGPTLNKHWVDVSCFLAIICILFFIGLPRYRVAHLRISLSVLKTREIVVQGSTVQVSFPL